MRSIARFGAAKSADPASTSARARNISGLSKSARRKPPARPPCTLFLWYRTAAGDRRLNRVHVHAKRNRDPGVLFRSRPRAVGHAQTVGGQGNVKDDAALHGLGR